MTSLLRNHTALNTYFNQKTLPHVEKDHSGQQHQAAVCCSYALELISAMSTLFALVKFTRSRVLVLPWKNGGGFGMRLALSSRFDDNEKEIGIYWPCRAISSVAVANGPAKERLKRMFGLPPTEFGLIRKRKARCS